MILSDWNPRSVGRPLAMLIEPWLYAGQLISLAAHNSYHLGRIVPLRQLERNWPLPKGVLRGELEMMRRAPLFAFSRKMTDERRRQVHRCALDGSREETETAELGEHTSPVQGLKN